MPASWAGVAWKSAMPRMAASLFMAMRALISVLPRLPMTTMRPRMRDDAEVLLEVHVGQHLQDDVGAAAAGQLDALFEVARRGVVEHVVRALLGDEAGGPARCPRCR